MRTLNLVARKYRIWLDELPELSYAAIGQVQRTCTAEHKVWYRKRSAAVEVLRNSEGSSYGLLGAEHALQVDNLYQGSDAHDNGREDDRGTTDYYPLVRQERRIRGVDSQEAGMRSLRWAGQDCRF